MAPIDFAGLMGPVARAVLGEPNQQMSTRSQLRFGTNGSVAVDIAGEKRGTWYDHEGSRGGGVLDLLREYKGLVNGSALEWLRLEVGADIPSYEPHVKAAKASDAPLKLVKTYDYTSEDGELLFQVLRYEPKTFRQRRPDQAGGWINSVKDIELVLYRLPEIKASKGPVYVVEGEKDADALAALGLTATSNAGGAGKWRTHYNAALEGRDVVILPDNDDAGRSHAQYVANSVRGTAASVRIIELPGLPEKGDVADWIARGGTADALHELANPPAAAPGADCFPLLWFDQIQVVADAKDFVQGLLVEQSGAVVYGESNAGKTFWATDLALHVAAGMEWQGRRVEGGPVIYCALEGGIGFQNRVAAWRADKGMEDAQIPFAAIRNPINFMDPEADVPRLLATLRHVTDRFGTPKLLVIDTLSRALAGGDENSSEDMGHLVCNMDILRQEIGCCVLFIHHSGKDAAKGARGHSLLRAAVDTEIEVKAEEGSDQKTATSVKQRELAKGQVMPFRLSVVEIGQNRHGEAVTTCLVREIDAGDMETGGGNSSRRMTGDAQVALQVLQDLLLEKGRPGFPGVPQGAVSVPDAWWRDQFYSRAKPGAERKTKEKAFRRASDALLERHLIALGNDRVWAV